MLKINLRQGDISAISVDAMVNAANSALLGGGGVDGAIHRRGGPEILAQCQQIRATQGGCRTGHAVITTAGRLSAKYVIHTVGPIWQAHSTQQAQLLAQCYQHSLALADRYQCRSIAFPNISTGVYHYPKFEAAVIALAAVKSKIKTLKSIQRIDFVCFDWENFYIYQDRVPRLFEL
jgi:O-acetyl-ADP-ribose deacetylase (regulator of RNase III)